MGNAKDMATGCFASVGMTIAIGLVTAIPVSMIAMGASYKDDCPAEDMIAIYLIVMGAVSCVRNFISIIFRCRSGDDDQTKVNPCTCVLDVFLLAWFIAGCVFIYRTKDDFQSHDSKADDFCNYTFYWYSFWVTTSSFIILGAILVIGCAVACCTMICNS